MKRIFIAGHGRCLENDKQILPANVSLTWFGEIGKSVTKGFTKAVLRGNIEAIGEASGCGAYSEHYLCETLQLEATLRVEAFQAGAWDAHTFMVQAKPGRSMRLSRLITYARARWPGEVLDLRWAVCRTSLRGGGVLIHDADPLTGIQSFRTSPGAPAPNPAGQLVGAVDDNTMWCTQWAPGLVANAMSPMPPSTF